MKDQYFGDVNDFRKYALLRSVVLPDLRLGVCWMLTKPDGGPDGKRLGYLGKPKTYCQSDPELFDWLKQVINAEQPDRRTARIEESDLLGSASFQPFFLTDDESQRNNYFFECSKLFADRDLVFFDPDTGLEVRSTARGRRHSCKYLYWDEVCKTFTAGASVLIYQHFPREKRAEYMDRMTEELGKRTRAAAVFSFRTPHVLFLLASQERHEPAFRARLPAIRSDLAPAGIREGPSLPASEPTT